MVFGAIFNNCAAGEEGDLSRSTPSSVFSCADAEMMIPSKRDGEFYFCFHTILINRWNESRKQDHLFAFFINSYTEFLFKIPFSSFYFHRNCYLVWIFCSINHIACYFQGFFIKILIVSNQQVFHWYIWTVHQFLWIQFYIDIGTLAFVANDYIQCNGAVIVLILYRLSIVKQALIDPGA